MSYILKSPGLVGTLLLEHLMMTGTAILIAMLIALPVGILLNRRPGLVTPVLGTFGILYTVPSIAMMILLIPLFGLNATTVVVSLVIYAQMLLVRNIVTGLDSIDPAILEAARGMGMSSLQHLWRVELPLALPIILAGLRISIVVCIGIATLGAKFGAGGLGRLLFDGIAQERFDKIWAGSLVLTVLALSLNTLLRMVERAFDYKAKAEDH